MSNYLALAAGFLILALSACNEPGALGSDFVDQDEVNIKTITDFDIKTKTIVRAPQTVYTNTLTIPNTFLLGHLDDPFLGESTAEIYSQIDFTPRKGNPFDTIQSIDSIILVLKYDTFGIYGSVEDMITVSVHEIEDELIETEEYKNDQTFMSSMTPLGSRSFVPSPYVGPIETDTSGNMDTLPAQMKIVLDNVEPLKMRLMNSDSVFWASPDTFRQEIFQGIHLKMDAPNTMLGFNFEDVAISRIRIHYTINDSTNGIYSFFMDDVIVKTAFYEHRYDDLAAQILSDSTSTESDTIMFLQEMQGLSPELTISGFDTLENVLINHATIEFTVADLEGDDRSMYIKPFLLTGEQYTDSTIVDIIDTRLAKDASQRGNSTSFYTSSFGGSCERIEDNGVEYDVYRTNITTYLQRLIDDGEDEAKLIIGSLLRPESPRRVLFYGSDSKRPVKLKVIYTEL